MLNKRGTDVSVMLNLQVEEEELINRLLERGKVSGRSDDNTGNNQVKIGRLSQTDSSFGRLLYR